MARLNAATDKATARGAFHLSGRTALLVGLAVVLIKLWLSHSEEICGSATRYDAFWFVNSAKAWYWGAEYTWTAFVRPPAYPLWLATIQALGIRQRLAIDLLQLSGFALLALGLWRAGVPRLACVAGFAAASFHPGSFWQNNYTMADPFYAAVLPMAIGGMLITMFRRSAAAAICTGGALAVLWLTREESVLVALLIAAFVSIWLWRARSISESWRTAAQAVAPRSAVMIGSFAALVLLAYSINNRTFSAFAKSEMSAPSYERALAALVRIKPPSFQRYVPVTSESLERAFAVSRTFARLKEEFATGAGFGWRTETLNQQGVSGEIGINYLMWALRNAAADKGVHSDAAKAEKFYNRMAREINAACDDGRIESRFVWASFIGPNLLPNAHHLPGSFAKVLGVFVLPYEMAALRDDEILSPEERAIYDEMTRRRPLEKVGPQTAPLATAIKNALGQLHRVVVISLASLGLIAASALAWRRQLHLSNPVAAAIALMFFAIASRVGLFTVIDATSWPVAYERFLFPVMPMASVCLIVLIFHAAAQWQTARGGRRVG